LEFRQHGSQKLFFVNALTVLGLLDDLTKAVRDDELGRKKAIEGLFYNRP
jgi:hypothetical protein